MEQTKHHLPEDDLGLHDPLAESFPDTLEGRGLFWLAFAFSVFQISVAAHVIDLPSQVVRAVHVGFLLALGLPLLAIAKHRGPAMKALSYALAGVGVAVAAYQWVEFTDLLMRAGDPLMRDIVFGVAALVTIFTAAWLLMGPALPIISGVFLSYALWG